jgi:transposase InsO family protein
MWSSPVPGFALFSHATFPWDTAPGYLLRDHDASYGRRERVEAMGITQVVTAPRSPRQNAYVKRVIGLIRRECLDHIVIFNERYLRRVLSSYVDYYHRSRTHLSLARIAQILVRHSRARSGVAARFASSRRFDSNSRSC